MELGNEFTTNSVKSLQSRRKETDSDSSDHRQPIDTYRRLKVVFADGAYGKSGLPAWVKVLCRLLLQTVLRPANVKGFVILPKR